MLLFLFRIGQTATMVIWATDSPAAPTVKLADFRMARGYAPSRPISSLSWELTAYRVTLVWKARGSCVPETDSRLEVGSTPCEHQDIDLTATNRS